MIAIVTFAVILILPNLIAEQVCFSRPCRYQPHLQLSMARRKGPGRELAVAAEPRRCTTGLQFAAALADQSVEDVVIITDITLEEADWSNFSLPLKLTRNVTVRGFDENRDNWVILDVNFIKNKVQLGAGVALMFEFLVLYRWREDPHFMAPGLDLIAPGPVPERADGLYWPAVMAQNAAIIQRTCAPVPDQLRANGGVERPAAFPGKQASIINASQDGCLPLEGPNTDDPRLSRPTRRCWPVAGLREDIVTFAYNLDKTGSPRRAGYLVFLRDCDYFCDKMMSENCTKEFYLAGCYWRMFPRNVSGGNIPAPPAVNDAHKAPSSSSSHDIMLGVALGGALGLCLVGLIGGVVTMVMYRRGCFHRGANPYHVKYFFGNRIFRNHGGKAGSVTDADDNSTHPIDGSDGSHSHLLNDRGKQQAIIALNLMKRSPPSGPLLRRSDELPLPAANNKSVDFPTDPLSLVPVTYLTPLHPGINLDVKLYGADLTLSEVTLGKGSFGRVVRGTYFGIPVAVKLINHGLAPSPCQKQEDLPQAALYQSTAASLGVSDTADNKKVLGSEIGMVMGGSGIHQQECGSAEQVPSSAGGNEDSHTTVCTADNSEFAAAGAMKKDGAGAVTGGDVERSTKFLYTSSEDSGTSRSRKPAAGDVKDMECVILDENSDQIDTTDQPTRNQCTSYADDNNAHVYIARSLQLEHDERIASNVEAQKPQTPMMNSVEATLHYNNGFVR